MKYVLDIRILNSKEMHFLPRYLAYSRKLQACENLYDLPQQNSQMSTRHHYQITAPVPSDILQKTGKNFQVIIELHKHVTRNLMSNKHKDTKNHVYTTIDMNKMIEHLK